MSDVDPRGILRSLVDVSFTSFVTTRVVRILYALGFFLGALTSVAAVLHAFSTSLGEGLGSLVLIPVLFLLFVMSLRVGLEVLAVVFRIAADVRALAAAQETSGADRP